MNGLTVCFSAELPEWTVFSDAQQTGLPPHRQWLHQQNSRLKLDLNIQFESFKHIRQHKHRVSVGRVYLQIPHLSLQNKSLSHWLIIYYLPSFYFISIIQVWFLIDLFKNLILHWESGRTHGGLIRISWSGFRCW